ncbi:GLTP domain-containing protein [Heracleum sosnowskyi]|uniref:GLTP domain-containing protein n=1 Tax=Heracleum sosnowskyi TaxID=360622 RepID=A0AAD8HXG0_9APIA|nr:GLTP domain-containing protein [Heracleum sosnowskyi]
MAFRSLLNKANQQFRENILFSSAMSDDDAFEDAGAGTSLAKIAGSFEELSETLESSLDSDSDYDLRLKPFCEACTLVSVLFGCLGIAFKFAEMEYTAKVRGLTEAAGKYETLNRILDNDMKNDTVKSPGSLSRNLRRVRQGLDLIRALFLNFLSSGDRSLKEAATTAYGDVCAPYHTWAVRAAVYAGMCALPTRQQLLLKLNETEETAEINMKRYISAAGPIIQYIDNLYIKRKINLDW